MEPRPWDTMWTVKEISVIENLLELATNVSDCTNNYVEAIEAILKAKDIAVKQIVHNSRLYTS